MKNYTYNFEIRNMIVQFMAALDDIVIARYDKEKNAKSRIKARVVYAPKQRVLADLLDKAQTIQLPVVSVYITGIGRDEGRVWNKMQGLVQPTGVGSYSIQPQPQPIDIQVGVTVLTKFQEDMDQILTNIIPYFTPYIIISWKTDNNPLHEIRSQVHWNGSASVSYPYDVSNAQLQRVQGELGFTIKGWLFAGDSSKPATTAPEIFVINSSYSRQRDNLNGPYTLNGLPYSTLDTDYFSLSARPYPMEVTPSVVYLPLQDTTLVSVEGKGFYDLTQVYLSGSGVNNTFQNPFSAYPNLSASCPPFSGESISSFISSNGTTTFVFPTTASSGVYNIILQNRAGYGVLYRSLTAQAN